MTKASAVAEAILRDRERRKSQAEAQQKSTRPRATIDFDPFEITRWRVIAGPDPGYLSKTPMRRGPVGWFINCGHCNVEFESKGWKYCRDCMELPAEERRQQPLAAWRVCEAPGCGARISPRRRADARYCERHSAARNGARVGRQPAAQKYEATRKISQQNQGPKNVLIGPGDFPFNVIGGYRFPSAKKLSLPFVQSLPLAPAHTETEKISNE